MTGLPQETREVEGKKDRELREWQKLHAREIQSQRLEERILANIIAANRAGKAARPISIPVAENVRIVMEPTAEMRAGELVMHTEPPRELVIAAPAAKSEEEEEEEPTKEDEGK